MVNSFDLIQSLLFEHERSYLGQIKGTYNNEYVVLLIPVLVKLIYQKHYVYWQYKEYFLSMFANKATLPNYYGSHCTWFAVLSERYH